MSDAGAPSLTTRVETLERQQRELAGRTTRLEVHGGNPFAPAPPPLPDIAPGSTGRILTVPGEYQTVRGAIAAAADGDTIRVLPACSRETFFVNKNLLVDGTGVRWDFSDVPESQLAGTNGAIVAAASGWRIKGFEISGAGIRGTEHRMVSAIRVSTAGHGTIDGCKLHGSQTGVGLGDLNWMVDIVDTEVSDCGLNDTFTHNIYAGGRGHTLRLRNVTSRHPRGGHALKSRAFHLLAEDSTFEAEQSAIDASDGGFLGVIGCTLIKPANSPNGRVLAYGVESGRVGALNTNIVAGSTMRLHRPNPFVQVFRGTVTFAADCVWEGNRPRADGSGSVLGLPA